jgi:PAS domain S-box-containing protein
MLHTDVMTAERNVMLDMASTQMGAFVVDERRRVVFWNDGAVRLLGYAAEEATGLRCCDIVGVSSANSADCAHCLGANTWAELLEGEVVRRVITATARDGSRKPVRMTTMLGHNADGAPRVIHFVREPRSASADQPAAGAPEGDRRAMGAVAADAASLTGSAAGVVDARRAITPTLTKREREVLRLLATGLSNGEIAGALRISRITARNHVTSVIEKLGVKTRLQAVVVATRKGWL